MTAHAARGADGSGRRVLLVRLSSIGDVIHSMPAFESLRAALPGAHIGWAVESAGAPLVRCIPDLDAVHEIDIQSWRGNLTRPSAWRRLTQELRATRREGYDVALDLQGLWKSAVVARLGARRAIGLAPRDMRERAAVRLYHETADAASEGTHITERGIGVVRALIPEAPATISWPRLAADAEPSPHGDPGAPILLHTFANWASKEYPDDAWVEVGRALHQATSRKVLWLWGPGEESRARRLAGAAGSGNEATVGLSLPELAALVAQSALVVGGDSAPLHLAVACGTPVTGLFGPTDPARLGPIDPADAVVVRRLECSHCHRRICPLGTNECLDTISPDEIVRAALDRLNGEH